MNGPRDVPQPIPYQGSKRQIAPTILQHFPATVSRLVEPFAGSAALSIAVAVRRRSDHFWINDAHSPLIQLWREIIHRPDELADKYTYLWNDQLGREREYFNEVRDRFNRDHDPADFFYLLARCVKAAIRYNANGKFNNTPENYAHIALRLIRRLDITWSGDEVPEYDHLVKLSKHARKKLPDFVKDVLREATDEESK